MQVDSEKVWYGVIVGAMVAGWTNYWGDNGPAGTSARRDASSFVFKGTNTYVVTLLGAYHGGSSTLGYFTKNGVTGGCSGGTVVDASCSDATCSYQTVPYQQFALMNKASDPTRYLVGSEDNVLGLQPIPGIDSDYNDYIWSIVATPPGPTTEVGTQGCSQGYFKHHIQPNNGTLLGTVFSNTGTAATVSMQNALNFAGGPTLQDKKNLLLKQAAAAWFNVNYLAGNYPLTMAQLISQVNAALASGNAAANGALQTKLDGYNNLEGPRC